MDRTTKTAIASIAWDLVIGSGSEGDGDFGRHPGPADLLTLRRRLGRSPTTEELVFFTAEWNRCLMAAAHP